MVGDFGEAPTSLTCAKDHRPFSLPGLYPKHLRDGDRGLCCLIHPPGRSRATSPPHQGHRLKFLRPEQIVSTRLQRSMLNSARGNRDHGCYASVILCTPTPSAENPKGSSASRKVEDHQPPAAPKTPPEIVEAPSARLGSLETSKLDGKEQIVD